MNPNPTELEKRQSRKKIIRHSPLYLLAGFIFVFSDHQVTRAMNAGKPVIAWIAAGIVASLALGFWLWLGARDTLKAEDELSQRIQLEALANALPFTIGLAILLMRLSQADIRFAPLSTHSLLWVLLLAPYAITTFLARRRYR